MRLTKSQLEEPIGTRFGRLVIADYVGLQGDSNKHAYQCLCDCGVEIVARRNNLLGGGTQSCGCFKSDRTKEAKTIHGRGVDDPTYLSWSAMRARCTNEKSTHYHRYGGRGISVCERWDSFINFLEDMGERPSETTLDRINNDGNYSKDNCRWATNYEQSRNKSQNRIIEIDGEKMILTDWAERFGIKMLVVFKRIQRGWSEIDALSKPIGTRIVKTQLKGN